MVGGGEREVEERGWGGGEIAKDFGSEVDANDKSWPYEVKSYSECEYDNSFRN